MWCFCGYWKVLWWHPISLICCVEYSRASLERWKLLRTIKNPSCHLQPLAWTLHTHQGFPSPPENDDQSICSLVYRQLTPPLQPQPQAALLSSISYSYQPTRPCFRPRCQLWVLINTDHIITRANHTKYSVWGSLISRGAGVICAVTCLQCPLLSIWDIWGDPYMKDIDINPDKVLCHRLLCLICLGLPSVISEYMAFKTTLKR